MCNYFEMHSHKENGVKISESLESIGIFCTKFSENYLKKHYSLMYTGKCLQWYI